MRSTSAFLHTMLAKRRPTPLIEVRAKDTLCRPSVWIQQGAPGKLRGCRGRRAKQTVLPGDSDCQICKNGEKVPLRFRQNAWAAGHAPAHAKTSARIEYALPGTFFANRFFEVYIKKYRWTLFREFGRQNGAPWPRGTARWLWQAAPVPLATRGQVPCPLTGPGLQNASFKKKRGGTSI